MSIPFIVGFAIMLIFGYSITVALLVGIVFVSSSVALVISSVKAAKLMGKQIGQTIVSATVLEDVASLFLLAFLLQEVSPITAFPLPIYIILLIASIFILRKAIPKLTAYYIGNLKNKKRKERKKDTHEKELRFVLVILMAVLLYFSGLGVHPIVAAFVVGLLLSDVIRSEELRSKIHAIGYGLFVPVFFFIIGMQLDLSILFAFDYRNALMISIIIGLIAAKILSGYFAGRLSKFSKKNSTLFGIASISQLTTTLAVVYAASTLGVLDDAVTTSIIILAIITTILAPILLNLLSPETSTMIPGHNNESKNSKTA